MFDVELPEFFKNDISQFFLENLNDLTAVKNNDFFTTEALQGFIDVADQLENALLDFVNIDQQKVQLFNSLQKKHLDNNEQLRDLNDQLIVSKIENRSFGKKDHDDLGTVNPNNINLLENE